MKTRITLAVTFTLALLMLWWQHGQVFSQQLPPGPTKVFEGKMPLQLDVIQVVLDFAPGQWTPPHTHGGQAFNTVLEGEITLRENGTEHIFKAGESWTDTIDQVHAAGNTGSKKARLMVTWLLPKGAQLTTVHEAMPTVSATPTPHK